MRVVRLLQWAFMRATCSTSPCSVQRPPEAAWGPQQDTHPHATPGPPAARAHLNLSVYSSQASAHTYQPSRL